MMIGHHPSWPDGTFMSASALISQGEAEALVRVLDQDRFFSEAGRFYSRRSTTPGPPPDGQAGLLAPNPDAHIRIQVTVHDDDWYRSYIHDRAWESDDREILRRLREQLQGPAAQLMDELIEQLP
jgi:hypothetical protein